MWKREKDEKEGRWGGGDGVTFRQVHPVGIRGWKTDGQHAKERESWSLGGRRFRVWRIWEESQSEISPENNRCGYRFYFRDTGTWSSVPKSMLCNWPWQRLVSDRLLTSNCNISITYVLCESSNSRYLLYFPDWSENNYYILYMRNKLFVEWFVIISITISSFLLLMLYIEVIYWAFFVWSLPVLHSQNRFPLGSLVSSHGPNSPEVWMWGLIYTSVANLWYIDAWVLMQGEAYILPRKVHVSSRRCWHQKFIKMLFWKKFSSEKKLHDSL